MKQVDKYTNKKVLVLGLALSGVSAAKLLHSLKALVTVNDYKDKVRAYYDIILDSPWDTDQDAIETLMFLSKLPTPYKLNLFSNMGSRFL